jgi:hypothetical protein
LTFAWLFAAGILLYGIWSLLNGHLRRDLALRREELAPGHILQDIKHHATLRFPKGEAARNYNTLQKLAYLGVLGFLIPGMILAGLTMSPAMAAAWPWLLDLFGGRQSARSIHFIAAFLLVAFFVVHIVMVILAGPINEVRSMITGRFRPRSTTGSGSTRSATKRPARYREVRRPDDRRARGPTTTPSCTPTRSTTSPTRWGPVPRHASKPACATRRGRSVGSAGPTPAAC